MCKLSIYQDKNSTDYLCSFLKLKDINSLILCDKISNTFKYNLYKKYKLEWSSSSQIIKNYINYSNYIYELTINNFDFITNILVNLKKLKILIIKDCYFNDLNFIKNYAPNLVQIYYN